ncbi:hypothetical protein C484_18437 [Natrialba taiwanensis DSM 12281]|uniref:Uncharacterized protein n=1 Tax=Natrialba taiwanensis DSM 12281 TaxID=1230458 RepID=L9ZIN0_9EURY|nr:hypothetical protein C484_18437 [Natrialba taiwanensis DSM 12281]
MSLCREARLLADGSSDFLERRGVARGEHCESMCGHATKRADPRNIHRVIFYLSWYYTEKLSTNVYLDGDKNGGMEAVENSVKRNGYLVDVLDTEWFGEDASR